MKIVLTGSDGYIGSILGPYLAERGHEVTGIDTGFFSVARLYDDAPLAVPSHRKDIRGLTPDDFADAGAVVHLAELSNDPLAYIAPEVTYDINHLGSLNVARNAKAAGVTRFVYTSSCSVYGAAAEDLVDEDSPLRPQTAYASCKELVERDVSAMADDGFSPTFLRNATAYGASPRMRFDIVLNNLAGLAWTTKEIRMESDGTPWRPLVHVLDICKAVACCLDVPRERVHGEILNVGDSDGNFQIREIAEIVAAVFPDCRVTVAGRGPDARSYRVSFAKIQEVLPEFRCEWNPELGARELLEIFSRIHLDKAVFESRDYTRLKQIEHLLRSRQLDKDFYWRELNAPTGPVFERPA